MIASCHSKPIFFSTHTFLTSHPKRLLTLESMISDSDLTKWGLKVVDIRDCKAFGRELLVFGRLKFGLFDLSLDVFHGVRGIGRG